MDFDVALATTTKLKKLVPPGASLAQLALKWILEFPAVTCAIPGAKRPAQVTENLAASDLKKLSSATMRQIEVLYAKQIKSLVHHYW